jgi:hypothetical protein
MREPVSHRRVPAAHTRHTRIEEFRMLEAQKGHQVQRPRAWWPDSPLHPLKTGILRPAGFPPPCRPGRTRKDASFERIGAS